MKGHGNNERSRKLEPMAEVFFEEQAPDKTAKLGSFSLRAVTILFGGALCRSEYPTTKEQSG
jgi:hypothetical protein